MEHIHNGCDDSGFEVGGTKKEVWASRGRGLLLNEDDHDTARPPTESFNVKSYLIYISLENVLFVIFLYMISNISTPINVTIIP